MMGNIFTDIKTSFGVFGTIRKARKRGEEVEVRHSMQIPYINTEPAFFSTVEGCRLANCDKDMLKKAHKAFSSLTSEEKHRLTFSPKNGEFVERANFWKTILKPVMTDKQYHIAIGSILHWYLHIKNIECNKGGDGSVSKA